MGPSRPRPSVKIAFLMERKTPRRFATTPGTRDVLPPESPRLLDVQAGIRERFRMFGFREVVTPALEYSEVIEEPGLRDASYKLFDPNNQMLLLRPEMTTPIARLVSKRLAGSPPPHKLSYILPAYRRASVGRGRSAELYQAGVEVVGSPSPQEDAATIALLVDVLESLGLRAPEGFAGGEEALAALENLREILRHLAAYGALGAVILDLGLIGRHDYYTGAVFEAYAAGLGFTIANGGRYDNLLERFGQDLSATGFAIYLERLLSVLPEVDESALLVLVGGGVGGTKTATGLRDSGVPTLHLPEDLVPDDALRYAASVEASWICYPAPEDPGG